MTTNYYRNIGKIVYDRIEAENFIMSLTKKLLFENFLTTICVTMVIS